jgi:hypothetical protein
MLAFTTTADAVRQEMHQHDTQPAGAAGARGFDERLLAERERLGLHQPHVARPPHQRQRDHGVDDAGP